MLEEVLFAVALAVAVYIVTAVEESVLRVLLLTIFATVLLADTGGRFRSRRLVSKVFFGAQRCLWVMRLWVMRLWVMRLLVFWARRRFFVCSCFCFCLHRRSPRLPFLLLGWQDSAEAGNGIESGRCGRLLLLFWTINPSASFPFCNVNNFAVEVAQMVSTLELESSLWSSDTWVGKLLRRSQKKYRKLTFVEDLESYLPEDP